MWRHVGSLTYVYHYDHLPFFYISIIHDLINMFCEFCWIISLKQSKDYCK